LSLQDQKHAPSDIQKIIHQKAVRAEQGCFTYERIWGLRRTGASESPDWKECFDRPFVKIKQWFAPVTIDPNWQPLQGRQWVRP
jgi:hypothetical protein